VTRLPAPMTHLGPGVVELPKPSSRELLSAVIDTWAKADGLDVDPDAVADAVVASSEITSAAVSMASEIGRLKAECHRLREMLRAERRSHAKTAKRAKVLAWERDAGLWRRRP